MRPQPRDLAALSSIPGAWVERAATAPDPGTSAVATELADAIAGLLGLDFAFVRLSDPAGGDPAESTRGDAWKRFRDWLGPRMHPGAGPARRELVAGVRDDPRSGRGLAVPIGLDGEGGMIAATARRADFPTATDDLLLSLAASHAATAFHCARLVLGRKTELERLAGEQAALRRVATLVAREASPAEVFAVIAEEHGRLMGVDHARMWRYEDDTVTTVASTGAFEDAMPVGRREPIDEFSLAGQVHMTHRSQRIDDYGEADARMAARALEIGIGCAVATPIIVEGRLWGAMVVASRRPRRLPADAEARMDQFNELMATAIANTESRSRADRLGEEQAALTRVATIVAEGGPPAGIFSAVCEEVRRLCGSDLVAIGRFDREEPAHVVVGLAGSTEGVAATGSRFELDETMAASHVYRTGRPARLDGLDGSTARTPVGAVARRLGVVSSVSIPIVVEGRLWGALSTSGREPLPADAEERLQKFTALVATAIANAESRAALGRLADEQAALRQVATQVAEGASAAAVFDAVAAEIKGLLGADHALVSRYETAEELTVLAHRGSSAEGFPPGTRIDHRGDSVEAVVRRTERSARMESYEGTRGVIAELARAAGVRVAVGAPVVVDGHLWGVVTAGWNRENSPPPETERRMAEFAQLLDTAIANADSRDLLAAQRARLLTAGDDARRRVVRDLHDGAQQRLVHTVVTLTLAQRALERGEAEAEAEAASLVAEALDQAQRGNDELRELAHGILPSVLTHGGLRAGVDAVVARLDLPVAVDIPAARFAAEIEASAYFIVAEALTNVVKHARARRAEVQATIEDGLLRVEVRDDGVGGADPDGHGLVGIADRVTALAGQLEIESPPGGGTRLTATLPVSARS